MADLLTTSQVAQMYGLADSTIRHYRSSGALVPSRQTPGGHARYTMADVASVLGEPGGEMQAGHRPSRGAHITGLTQDAFAAPGEHDLRSSGRGGIQASEIVALGVRESIESAASRDDRARWGGRLLKARARVAA